MHLVKADQKYPSDLSLHQWELIEGLIPAARKGGRPRSTNVRWVVNAIFFLSRTGCAWRYLPKHYPPWRTVYDYFTAWVKSGVWSNIQAVLCEKVRVNEGRQPHPSALIIDSQSVKAHYGESRGYDPFKKVRGRKRHILVDTLGILHGIRISPANGQDRVEGDQLVQRTEFKKPPEVVFADSAYNGIFANNLYKRFKIHPKVTWDPETRNNLKPKRWIVERTFAWFNHFRRLSRDYERKTSHSESMIHIAGIQLLLRRLLLPRPST